MFEEVSVTARVRQRFARRFGGTGRRNRARTYNSHALLPSWTPAWPMWRWQICIGILKLARPFQPRQGATMRNWSEVRETARRGEIESCTYLASHCGQWGTVSNRLEQKGRWKKSVSRRGRRAVQRSGGQRWMGVSRWMDSPTAIVGLATVLGCAWRARWRLCACQDHA